MQDYYEASVSRATPRRRTSRRPSGAWPATRTPMPIPSDPAAEAKFREIAEAYEVLSDPQRRARYDRGEQVGAGDLFSSFGGLDDILQQFFGGGGFGGGGSVVLVEPVPAPRRGSDLAMGVDLTLAEAATGVSRDLDFAAPSRCAVCAGTGAEPGHDPMHLPDMRRTRPGPGAAQHVPRCDDDGHPMLGVQRSRGQIIEQVCHECRGVGLVEKTERSPSRSRRVSTMAPAFGCRGGAAPVKPARLRATSMSRSGSPPTPVSSGAVTTSFTGCGSGWPKRRLGWNFRFPWSTVKPPRSTSRAGTQPGTVYRLSKQGMPRLRRRGRGDLLVEIDVAVPEKLSDEEEGLLRQFAELRGEQPAEGKRRRRRRGR